MKILIVGGVAAGASAAAKARRTNESAEIILFERGPFVSFANCGLPYYIGGDIGNRGDLLIQTPDSFRKRFNVDARVFHEVLRIDRAGKRVEVKDLKAGKTLFETYDKLILAPGAGAIVPDLPGIRADNIFVVKTVPDSDAVKSFLQGGERKNAAVIGAGFIGLEAAEALKKRGLNVTVIEMLPQVLPPFDADMASFVAQQLEAEGINLILSDGVKAFHGGALASEVELSSGRRVPMDLAILSIGVRPELKLARDAGLEIGDSGGIKVNEFQQTSDLDIYAAGDAAETMNLVTGLKARIPLAGPANKQGRAAGANAAGDQLSFPGAYGTAIVETMGITAGKTGLSERDAQKAGIPAYASYTHSLDHAGYYPGSHLMHIKILVEEKTGRLLGAQIVGESGVDKRIDVFATALASRLKVTDLENLDLAYAPQFSSAKDPVNMAGFVASNVYRHTFKAMTCDALRSALDRREPVQVVDVRTRSEFASGHLDRAHLIPVDELRQRMGELDPSAKTVVYCKVGLRGYLAARVLEQNGFKEVYNLSGGLLSCPPAAQAARSGQSGQTRPAAKSTGVTAGPAEVREKVGAPGTLVVDVRDPDEFAYERIAGTLNIPQSSLNVRLKDLPRDKSIYLVCSTGARSAQSLDAFKSEGFRSVYNMEGGIAAWKKAGMPVEKRKGPIPIMRQVQIVAGSLALVGGLFAPLHWVSIIVGAGLVFAGVSGTCTMARVLSWMPWNKPVQGGPQGPDCGTRCN